MARTTALVRPLRLRMLERLVEPASASGLARQLRQPRQKVNYHLRALEKAGLVELVEERRVGNCMERIVRATGRAYLVGAEALAALAAPPGAVADRFSSAYLTAVAARAVGEVASLRARAERAGRRLATYTLQTQLRFAS